MTNKVYKQKMFFSILAKTLNWEVLTKNLVTFKRWDRMRVFQIALRGGGKFLSMRVESETLWGWGFFYRREPEEE